MKAVILCAGEGTRMRPFTYSQPKHLLPVANRPIIQWIFDAIHSVGISETGLVVSPTTRGTFQQILGDGSQFGMKLTYIVQDKPKGLAHAVSCAERFVDGSPFLLYLGDNLFEHGVGALVQKFRTGDCSAAIALIEVHDPGRFGVARVEAGEIQELVEKPENPPSNLAIAGAYVFDSGIFDAIGRINPSKRGELEITDAIQRLIDDNHTVLPHTIQGWWKDVGQPRDMIIANELMVGRLEPTTAPPANASFSIEGTVVIEAQTHIERSHLIGPVIIGKGAKICDATIGPNVVIGSDCTVSDSCIRNSLIFEGAEVRGVQQMEWSIIGRAAHLTQPTGQQSSSFLVGDHSNAVFSQGSISPCR